MKRTYSYIALFLLAAPLLLSLIQYHFQIIPEKPLHGDFPDKTELSWSLESWLSRDFQKQAQQKTYAAMGFRPALIRLKNQIDFSLLGQTPGNVIEGKNQELYSKQNYLTAMGEDWVGDTVMQQRVLYLKVLQQFLKTKNTELFVYLTPNKLRAYPENLPDGFRIPSGIPNNYRSFLAAAETYKLEFRDLLLYLLSFKEQASHPVFPNTGYHWSDFGAAWGADLILRDLREKAHQPYPVIRFGEVQNSQTGTTTDQDLGESMNMLQDYPFKGVGLPQLDFNHTAFATKPRVLVISDSFWWKVWDLEIMHHHFAPGSAFWYYFDEAWSPDWKGKKKATDFDFLAEVEKADFVLLLTNEGNLYRFPFGFSENLIGLYQQKGELGSQFQLDL